MKRAHTHISTIGGWALLSVVWIYATQDVIQVSGVYSNFDYAYRITVPDGLMGFRASSPAPNHGFGVSLGQSAELWVDASYNSMLWESLDAAADGHVGYLREEGFGGVKQTERSSTSLGSLHAVRLVASYIDKRGTAMAEELILAMRDPKVKGDVGIVYSIAVRFPQSRREAVEPVLQQFVRAFQLQPLP